MCVSLYSMWLLYAPYSSITPGGWWCTLGIDTICSIIIIIIPLKIINKQRAYLYSYYLQQIKANENILTIFIVWHLESIMFCKTTHMYKEETYTLGTCMRNTYGEPACVILCECELDWAEKARMIWTCTDGPYDVCQKMMRVRRGSGWERVGCFSWDVF